jgi:serine O-acetyltransferase
MTLFQLIQSDYKKHRKYGGRFFVIFFFTQGFWASSQYRIANYIYTNVHIPLLRQLLLFTCLIGQKIIEMSTGISIPASAKIGHSFYIGHFGGIIINSEAIIGTNCNISQGVTIGVSGLDEKRGIPIIGNEVYVGANSVVAGKIVIGNNVLIGACSMVNRSLSDSDVALGVPAVVVSQNGSKGYI